MSNADSESQSEIRGKYSWMPLWNTSSYLALLHVAHFFGAEEALEFASGRLDGRDDFKPADRLVAARCYRVFRWIDPAVRQLVALPRKKLAVTYPEARHSLLCNDGRACSDAWHRAWWGEHDKHGFARALLHPTKARSGRAIHDSLETVTSTVNGMGVGCLRYTIEAIRGTTQKPSALLREDAFVNELIDGFVAALHDSI